MIIFDGMGHMVSTESAKELHEFARSIGLKREWYQTPGRGEYASRRLHPERYNHYDLTTFSMREKARTAGAEFVQPPEILRRAWWAKKPKGEH